MIVKLFPYCEKLTLYINSESWASSTFHCIITTLGFDCDVILLVMLECEGQLSCLKKRTVPSNSSTGWQENGGKDCHFITTDVGIVSARNAPHHSHLRE